MLFFFEKMTIDIFSSFFDCYAVSIETVLKNDILNLKIAFLANNDIFW